MNTTMSTKPLAQVQRRSLDATKSKALGEEAKLLGKRLAELNDSEYDLDKSPDRVYIKDLAETGFKTPDELSKWQKRWRKLGVVTGHQWSGRAQISESGEASSFTLKESGKQTEDAVHHRLESSSDGGSQYSRAEHGKLAIADLAASQPTAHELSSNMSVGSLKERAIEFVQGEARDGQSPLRFELEREASSFLVSLEPHAAKDSQRDIDELRAELKATRSTFKKRQIVGSLASLGILVSTRFAGKFGGLPATFGMLGLNFALNKKFIAPAKHQVTQANYLLESLNDWQVALIRESEASAGAADSK